MWTLAAQKHDIYTTDNQRAYAATHSVTQNRHAGKAKAIAEAVLHAAVVLPEVIEPDSAYVANMRALWEKSRDFAHLIDLVDESELIACEPSRRGSVTCRVPGASGALVYLHSKYDPMREAQKWADGIIAQADTQASEKDGHFPMCYFIDGFGLGYHVKALFDRLPGETVILVSERNVALLRTALEQFDYSEMFASDRVEIITRADREEAFNKLQVHGNAMMMGTLFTRSMQNQVDVEFHREVHTMVSEYAAFLRSHMISLLANSSITCENVLLNLGSYVGTGSVGVLKNRFQGCPAVVVSAGPSLGKNLELLKEIRDRVIVIAVQTTLKPLLNFGITPDFVTSLDYHEVGTRFYEGLEEELRDVHLVAEPKANWRVIDYYRDRGPMSLLGNEVARLALGEENDDHANIPAGATVAHLAFYLGEYIGADPVIFIGQDLGYSNNVYYSPGTALHTVWQGEFNRFCTVEMKEWERIVRSRNILRLVEDVHGQPIYTDEQMFTYLQQFEKDFAKSKIRVIDATGGGTRKQGAEIMSLREAADAYCGEPIDRSRFAYRQELRYDAGKLDETLKLVKERIEEVEDMEKICSETIELVKEMVELVEDQTALNQKMIRLDELRAMVKQREKPYQMISYVAQDAELYRFRADRRLGVEEIEGKVRQKRQLQRDIGYVSALKRGCERLLWMMRRCVERLEEEREEG